VKGNCAFIKLGKKPSEITLKEAYRFLKIN
jgi:hypothetical protein